jgi:predicted DNA-binding ArsR family transcriptional regulator
MRKQKTYMPIDQLNDHDKDRVKKAIHELDNSYVRMEGERALQKSVLDDLEDSLNIDKKIVRKIAKVYHKQNIEEVRLEVEELETSYDTFFKPQV